MRLLEYKPGGDIGLTEDLIDGKIPPYAILSHTWGPEEVTYDVLLGGQGKGMLGYEKIQFCGEQARQDGLSYFWVDTCCIKKSDSSELQEAINSMFRWYHDATKCYVHLCDVSTTDGASVSTWETAFLKSRWFTRGWTLQELIAPVSVGFFSKDGTHLGNRESLKHFIHRVTGIPEAAFQGTPLCNFTIEERMDWAKLRETTRKEDKAYSLLGIFGIYMPLIYGEGEKNAFRRLREELNKSISTPVTSVPYANNAAFDSHAEEHSSRCYPDTRTEILNEIQEWVSEPDGKSIFWLNGAAGTGKSTISRTLASDLKTQGVLGASFFFKRGERDRGSISLFFTTIALQLASKEPRMAGFIHEVFESDRDIATKALRDQFESLILQPLHRVHSGYHPQNPRSIVIVVDALDECDSGNDVRLLIHLLAQTRDSTSVKFRIFLTSRPELPIRLGFNDIHGEYQDIALHQIQKETIDHDLRIFFSYKLGNIRDDYNCQVFEDQQLPLNWPGDQIIQTLTHIASPLFIFASTICRFIADETWLDPIGQLDKVLTSENFRSCDLDELDRTYLPVLDQLLEGKKAPARNQLIEEFRRLVGSIVLLAEPLSAASVARLLGISTMAVSRILNRLHAVLDIPSRSDERIRIFHLSFRDFLLDPDKGFNPERYPFWIDERETHEQLAHQSLRLLSEPNVLKRDICGLRFPGTLRSEIAPQTIDDNIPFEVQYACQYWVYHWTKSQRRISDNDSVARFLTCHLLHWLEVLGVLGKISESPVMLQDLLEICDPKEKISQFIYDALRTTRSYCSLLSKAPLQVYHSALVFAPERSTIRKTFRDQFPTWLTRFPQPELDWDACLQTFEGHSDSVTSAIFSPDGKYIASSSDDCTIKLWNIMTGICIATFQGHTDFVFSVDFSHDSKRLASGSTDSTIKLWDVELCTCIGTLEGHRHTVLSIAFSHDSTLLASGSADSTIKLWDISSGVCIATLEGHESFVRSVVFSHNSKLIASGSLNSIIKLWNVKSGACMRVFTVPGSQRSDSESDYVSNPDPGSVFFSHDSKLLASGWSDGRVRIWNLELEDGPITLEGHGDDVSSIHFSHDSSLLTTSSLDNTVRVWNMNTCICEKTFDGHSSIVNSARFSNDSKLLVSTPEDRTIKLWDLNRSIHGGIFEEQSLIKTVGCVAFSPDFKLLSSSSQWKDTVKLWDVVTGAWVKDLVGSSRDVDPIEFSPDSQLLVTVEKPVVAVERGPQQGYYLIKIWNILTGANVRTLQSGGRFVRSVKFSTNSNLLASASDGVGVQIWDVATGTCLASHGGLFFATSLAFSYDSRLLAAASLLGTVDVWNVTSSVCTATLEPVRVAVNPTHASFERESSSLAFSPDSKNILSATENSILVWNLDYNRLNC